MEKTISARFILVFKEKIYARLDRKTGWGKEELKREIDQAIMDALLEVI